MSLNSETVNTGETSGNFSNPINFWDLLGGIILDIMADMTADRFLGR
jgi:hypothetical protein